MRTRHHSALSARDAGGGREVRSFALQIKAAGDDGTVEVTAPFSACDNYDDVIAKGAFIQSLKRPQGGWNHARHALAARCRQAYRRLDGDG